jgi:hypothetical protein
MTYLEAAIKVLGTSQEPLTAAEITDRIIASGLVYTEGRTPEATLKAVLYRNLGTHPQLRRVAQAGRKRAVRGSVRWTLAR